MNDGYSSTTEVSSNEECTGFCDSWWSQFVAWCLIVLIISSLFLCCKQFIKMFKNRQISRQTSTTENQANVAARNQVPTYSESRIGASTNSAWESYPEDDLTQDKLPTYEEYMQEKSCEGGTSGNNSAQEAAVNIEIELRATSSNRQSSSLQTTATARDTEEDNEELNENPPPPYFPT